MRNIFLMSALLFAGQATAAVTSDRPDSVTVTIYRQNIEDTATIEDTVHSKWPEVEGIAFIAETRTVDVPQGDSIIEFRGVASTIVAQTADVTGLPGSVSARNYDYDLLSPGSLLEKSIGEKVRVVRTDPRTGMKSEESAVIRSAPDGTILDEGGRIEALKCSGLPEKIVFDRIPAGLRDKPTLSIRVHAARAGRYTVKLSYLASGFDWSADYVARIRPDGRSLDLSGSITLFNLSETGYPRIPLEVVAGMVDSTGDDEPAKPRLQKVQDNCWPTKIDWTALRKVLAAVAPPPPPPAAPPPSGSSSVETVVVTGSRIPSYRLGDYKLYALPEPTQLPPHEIKQVQFLSETNVPFKWIYGYTVQDDDQDHEIAPATVYLRMRNEKSEGLGDPLPAGTISVEEPGGGGDQVLAGQGDIHDIAEGLPVHVELGDATDVRVDKRIMSRETTGTEKDGIVKTSYEIVIENNKRIPISFELIQPLDLPGIRIVSEDNSHVIEPGGAVWSVEMQPGEMKVLHYKTQWPREF